MSGWMSKKNWLPSSKKTSVPNWQRRRILDDDSSSEEDDNNGDFSLSGKKDDNNKDNGGGDVEIIDISSDDDDDDDDSGIIMPQADNNNLGELVFAKEKVDAIGEHPARVVLNHRNAEEHKVSGLVMIQWEDRGDRVLVPLAAVRSLDDHVGGGGRTSRRAAAAAATSHPAAARAALVPEKKAAKKITFSKHPPPTKATGLNSSRSSVNNNVRFSTITGAAQGSTMLVAQTKNTQKDCHDRTEAGKTEAAETLKPEAANFAIGEKTDHPAAMMGKNGRHQELEQDLICPISLELPIDPVFADDGHVYERFFIEGHLKKNGLTSPLTREKVSKKLVPAISHRKIIEAAIKDGTVSEETSKKWKERKDKKKAMDDLLARAEGGDVKAMEQVARNYHGGENGFPEDDEAAYSWYEKAHREGSVVGMAEMGDMLVIGDGVPQNEFLGLTYLGIAAGKGSDLASYALGIYFAEGDHGLPVDRVKAIELLQDSLRICPHACMNDKAKTQARKKLYEILNSPDNDPLCNFL